MLRFFSPLFLSTCALFLSLNSTGQSVSSLLKESTTEVNTSEGGGNPMDFNLEVEVIQGCTYAIACNYNPEADDDDGSCEFLSCGGCTIEEAINYDASALIDNGSCILPGCTDPAATNYNPYANQPDGSCVGGDAGCPGDFNFDGLVGVADLILFLQNFGHVCGGPETGCAPVSMDGYTYSVVEIGDQCWFAENLRTTTYRNGDVIPAGVTDGEWTTTTSGATAVFGEDSGCSNYSPEIDACDEAQSLAEYGRLYNGYAVDNASGLCPSGWHVPTDGEWMVLEMELGMSESEANSTGYRGTDEGTQLKSTIGWNNDGNGTDDLGFSALPGGFRSSGSGYFDFAGNYGYWWSSSPNGDNAWYRDLNYGHPGILRYYSNPRIGFSVRCLRDAE
jgi:uncharacterized protein (TIGR02145 family)